MLYDDDAKILKTIVSHLNCIHLQANLDAISLWCTTCQLHLNIAECFTVRFGLIGKPYFSYPLNGTVFAAVKNATDLDAIFRMFFTNLCHLITRKAFDRANLILRCFFFNTDRFFFYASVWCMFTPCWNTISQCGLHTLLRIFLFLKVSKNTLLSDYSAWNL